jgi:hypothetical protein
MDWTRRGFIGLLGGLAAVLGLAAPPAIAAADVTIPAPLPALLTFRPSPPLARLQHDSAQLIAIRAANKAGKTFAVMRKLAKRALDKPGSCHRVVGPSRGQVREVTGRYLWLYLRPYVHPSSRWYAGTGWNRNGVILLKNGSEIQLSSYQDDPEVQEGRHDLDTIVLDEVPKYAHFMANKGRAGFQLILSFTVQTKAPPDWLRKEIEGAESNVTDSPTDGRTEHDTGWVQYVVPMLRHNVPWFTEEEYEKQVSRFRGTDEEKRRLWARWEGTDADRAFSGWHGGLVRSREQLIAELWDPRGRQLFRWARIGMDHGSSGPGKQVVYLIVGFGTRYYVLHEWLGIASTNTRQIAQGIIDCLKAWNLGLQHVEGIYGDINSAGPAGAGQKLNAIIEAELADLLNLRALPHSIQAPVKTGGWKEAREVAINYAMLEGRFLVCSQCVHAIRAFGNYGGHPRDPLKDPIDGMGYAVQDRIVDAPRAPSAGVLRH